MTKVDKKPTLWRPLSDAEAESVSGSLGLTIAVLKPSRIESTINEGGRTVGSGVVTGIIE